MEHIIDGQNYSIYWHNPERSILVLEITGPWTWDDAYVALGKLSAVVAGVRRSLYTIIAFGPGTSIVPRGFAMPNIKRLLTEQHDHEQLVIIVNSGSLIEVLVNMVGKVYKMERMVGKHRFVRSTEEALKLIAEHQTVQARKEDGL